jgi:hypothetical protein
LDFPEAFEPIIILKLSGSIWSSRKLLKLLTEISLIGMREDSLAGDKRSSFLAALQAGSKESFRGRRIARKEGEADFVDSCH